MTGEVEAFIGAQADDVSSASASPVITISGAEPADGDVIVDADSTMTATATAYGISGSFGLTISLTEPKARVSGATRAYVRDGVDLTSDTLKVEAGVVGGDRVQYTATSTTFLAGFSGIASVSVIDAEATVDGEVAAFIGTPIGQSVGGGAGVIDVDDVITIEAASDMNADADLDNVGISGAVSVGVLSTLSDVAGATRAYVGQGADILANGLEIDADGDYDANATTLSVNASGFFSAADLEAHAIVSGTVDAHAGAAANTVPSSNIATIDVGSGDIDITAIGRMLAKPDIDSVGIAGGATVSDIELIADVTGTVHAYIGEGVDVDAGSVDVLADAPEMKAEALGLSLGFAGLVNAQFVTAISTVSGAVEAYIGAHANDVAANVITDVDVNSGSVTVVADSFMNAVAHTDGGGFGGLVSIGNFKPTAIVSGRTGAYVRDGVNMDAGELDVSAGKLGGDRVQYKADATSFVANVALVTIQDALADGFVSGATEAYVGATNGLVRGGAHGAKLDISGPLDVEARADIEADANTDGGGGSFGVDLTSFGPVSDAGGVTRAYAGDGLNVNTSQLTLKADGDANADAELFNLGFSFAVDVDAVKPVAKVSNIVEAYLGENRDTARTTQADIQVRSISGGRGTVDVDAVATSVADARATSGSGSLLVSVGSIEPKAELVGATRAYVGPRTDLFAGDVALDADELFARALATADGGSGTLGVAVSTIKAEAAASRVTEAFVGHHADIDLGGFSLTARADATMAQPLAEATISTGSGAGLANVNVLSVEARVGLVNAIDPNSQSSATRAFIDHDAEIDAFNLTLDADADTEAKAISTSHVTFAGLADIVAASVKAVAAHDTEAYVGDDVKLTLSGALNVDAAAATTATPLSNANSLSPGVSYQNTDVVLLLDSDTAAWIGDGGEITADSVKVKAEATHIAEAQIDADGFAGLLAISDFSAEATDSGSVAARIGPSAQATQATAQG